MKEHLAPLVGMILCFSIVSPSTGQEPHEKWLAFLAGSWEVRCERDPEQKQIAVFQPAANGKALTYRKSGVDPKQIGSAGIIGWQADRKQLVDTFFDIEWDHTQYVYDDVTEMEMKGRAVALEIGPQKPGEELSIRRLNANTMEATHIAALGGDRLKTKLTYKRGKYENPATYAITEKDAPAPMTADNSAWSIVGFYNQHLSTLGDPRYSCERIGNWMAPIMCDFFFGKHDGGVTTASVFGWRSDAKEFIEIGYHSDGSYYEFRTFGGSVTERGNLRIYSPTRSCYNGVLGVTERVGMEHVDWEFVGTKDSQPCQMTFRHSMKAD